MIFPQYNAFLQLSNNRLIIYSVRFVDFFVLFYRHLPLVVTKNLQKRMQYKVYNFI